MDSSLSLPILSGGIRTRHPEVSAMGEEEDVGAVVVKLTPIIALEGFDGDAKLCGHKSKEIRQSGKFVRVKA